MWVFTGKELINIQSATKVTLDEDNFKERSNSTFTVSFKVLALFSEDESIELANVYLAGSTIIGVNASNYKSNPIIEKGRSACEAECMKCIHALNAGFRGGLSYCDISETFHRSVYINSDGTIESN